MYLLTLCTFARRRCFTDEALVDVVRLQFVKAADAHEFDLLAYCFMPDHLHLLVEGRTPRADPVCSSRLPSVGRRMPFGLGFVAVCGNPGTLTAYFAIGTTHTR